MPRIERVSRVVAHLERATAFYRGLGFQLVVCQPCAPTILAALGARSPATEAVLTLGGQEVALVAFAQPGRPIPTDGRADDLAFQHLALMASDIDAAHARLDTLADWRPISAGGVVTLPPVNGAVRAFKFRDPEGHPLELLWFPPGQGRSVWHEPHAPGPLIGIDHSALACADTERSVDFYRRLGFMPAQRSLNEGPAQAALDGVPGARVAVTSLRLPGSAGMGLELLAYDPPGRPAPDTRVDDGLTDWVSVRGVGNGLPEALRDPDGHRLVLLPAAAG